MLPSSIFGVFISILVIIGIGAVLYALAIKQIAINKDALAYYAFLVIMGIIHPIGTAISVVVSVYLLIRGKISEKFAAGAFLIVAFVIFLISHAFLIFHL